MDPSTPARPHRYGGAGDSEDRFHLSSEPQLGADTLLEYSPDPILVFNGTDHCEAANRAACDLTGYNRDELLGLHASGLDGEQEEQGLTKQLRALRESGHHRWEQTLRGKGDRRLTADVHGAVLGTAASVLVIRDVTAAAIERAKLERSLHAYTTLLDLCHAALVSASPEGTIASWNPAAESLFGFSTQEAVGMPLERLVPLRHRAKHRAAFAAHLDRPHDEPFARVIGTEAQRKDGTEFPAEISLTVGGRGERPLFTAVIRDVTEHHRMVETLNDALQQLRFHVERMPLAYIVWDTQFRVMEWNRTAEHTFGYTKSEAYGRHAYDLIVPPDARAAVDNVWADLLQGDTSSHSTNPNMRKDGSRLTCEWFNTPLRDSNGNIRGVASMAMDVSERQAMEARIRDAQKLESLGVMASGIAHDFNSSLMVMLGNTALLRSLKGLPPRATEHLELIEEAGARADELIKHLLRYARTGRHNPQPTDLNTVIQEAMKLIRSSLGKHHEVTVDLVSDLPIIHADRSQLEQILLNLCLNAKEAMPDGGVVRLATRVTQLTASEAAACVPYTARPGTYVELRVADPGCGMDDSTVARIFDPFFSTKVEGHGLGLAAVLGILRQHNAAAKVESKRREGTTVHVFFPIRNHANERADLGIARRRSDFRARKRRPAQHGRR